MTEVSTEIFRALAVLAELPGPEQARLGALLEIPGAPTRHEHTELFEFQCWPYASVYLGHEGMLGGEARDRVAGFWRALRLQPPAEPDHLTVLLALYANLSEREAAETDPARAILRREARRALLWEHVLTWIFPYLSKLEEMAGPFYRGWSALRRDALLQEAEWLGCVDGTPSQLRDELPVADPAIAGAEEFLRGLLTPARSGIILVRSDLSRAAHSLGLGIRAGERRFVVESLLSQDAAGTLEWLLAESRAWLARHETWAARLGVVGAIWTHRAGETAAMLQRTVSLARNAGVAARP
jgi:TorA maturation chaperone TorD